jgi:KDO2-lipid IV(A) lauroyltransferase
MVDANADVQGSGEGEEHGSPGDGSTDAAEGDVGAGGDGRTVWKKGKKRRRSRLRKAVSRWTGYMLLRAVHAVVSRLPFRAGRALSWLVGTIAYFLSTRERNIALHALTRVYAAERSPAEIRALARDVFRHTVSIAVDWIILRRWSREKLARAFPGLMQDIHRVEEAVHSAGNGVVGITAHLGNWEVLGLIGARWAPGLFIPVAQRLYYPKYQDFLHRLRTENGNQVIYTDESPRKMIRALREGCLVGFLPDQDVRTNRGVFVDFLGLPAWTAAFPVAFARRQGVKMLFIVVVREGKGFRVLYRGPFDLPSTGDEDADVLAGTQLWTRMLEEEIRKRPHQWSWLHPRWRTVPGKPRHKVDRSFKTRPA